jgi:hypothetical protein
MDLEDMVTHELLTVGMPEVAGLAVMCRCWVAIVDLDMRGTASIVKLLTVEQYSALIDDEEADYIIGLPASVFADIPSTRH